MSSTLYLYAWLPRPSLPRLPRSEGEIKTPQWHRIFHRLLINHQQPAGPGSSRDAPDPPPRKEAPTRPHGVTWDSGNVVTKPGPFAKEDLFFGMIVKMSSSSKWSEFGNHGDGPQNDNHASKNFQRHAPTYFMTFTAQVTLPPTRARRREM